MLCLCPHLTFILAFIFMKKDLWTFKFFRSQCWEACVWSAFWISFTCAAYYMLILITSRPDTRQVHLKHCEWHSYWLSLWYYIPWSWIDIKVSYIGIHFLYLMYLIFKYLWQMSMSAVPLLVLMAEAVSMMSEGTSATVLWGSLECTVKAVSIL